MRQTKQGVRSTKIKLEPNETLTPSPKQCDIFVKMENMDTIYSDQTGKFPTRSSRGNKYIMIMCEIDGNGILSAPMKNRTAGEIVKTYQSLINRLATSGIHPKKHILDNKISKEYKKAIKRNNMTYQLVPPDVHRQNIAKKAISIFKDHLIVNLCSVHESFPLHLWDQLLPQVDLTLNLLRQANAAPKVSAHAYLHGQHDYNAMPLAPLGCAVQMHDKPNNRTTWAPHAIDGWYINTSPDHYRCFTIFNKETRAERVSDTVFFKHKYLTQPTVTPKDAIMMAAKQLAKALAGDLPATLGETELQALERLQNAFTTAVEAQEAPQQRVQKEVPQPRVAPATTPPRVQEKEAPPLPEGYEYSNSGLIVAYPQSRPPQALAHNYITQDDDAADAPAHNTRARSRTQPLTITQESMLSMLEINNCKLSPRQMPTGKYPLQFLCDFAGAVMDAKSGELLSYRQLMKRPKYKEIWGTSAGNEIGRLAQGMPGRVEGTNTMFFIHKNEVPADRFQDCTYGKFCVMVRPEKIDEPNRTRLTMGGDRINYPDDVGTPTADLLTVKMLLNSVISTEGAKFMTLDIKKFYLNTPMARFEYLRLKLTDLPQDIIDEYKLEAKVDSSGFVYAEVQKGMYGLPQAGLLAQELLEERLNKHGYKQSLYTPGLWSHATRNIQFTLVVDDFGVKYVGKENADHLISCIKEHYKISEDWDLGRRKILRSHHGLGLQQSPCKTKSACINARI